ncbi:MAG TPA: Gfo/Idh/MocA family oxidoreductase [Gemmatimonadaceae bacterium]
MPVEPVRWGVLGAARIALDKVIPSMQEGELSRVVAIASRSADKARAAAGALGIDRAYDSYDALIADPDIEAIYNPLPNHLHVPWSIRAVQAGKHVLCEKPIAMTAEEAVELRSAARHAGVLVGEAFMVRAHPQWIEARRLIVSGRIGALQLVHGHFSYPRRDASDVRSRVDYGGGALMDIGCYPIVIARWMFGSEPVAAVAAIDRDPEFHVDRITSGLLRFDRGIASFDCGGSMVAHQRMELFGDRGLMQVDLPFTPRAAERTRIVIEDGSRSSGEVVEIDAANQYTLQGDRFSAAVRGIGEVPSSIDSAIANMRAIDALFRSAETGRWEAIAPGS